MSNLEEIPVKFKKRLFEEKKELWLSLLEEAAPSTDLGRGRTTSSMIPNLGQHRLETELKSLYKRKFCVFTNCATDALDLVVAALGYPAWQVPAYTWYSPINAIGKSGAEIHFLDVDFQNRYVDYSDFDSSLPCIVPHVDGLVAPPPPESCPFVLEDAAQSPLSPGNNFGDAVVLSFGSSKKLGLLGQGGGILTNDEDLARRLKVMSVFGLDANRDLELPGYKSFLDPYNALCTSELIRWYQTEKVTSRLAQIISYYNDCTGLQHPETLERYTVKLRDREKFRIDAEDRKIETRIWFKDHAANFPCYQQFRKSNTLEQSDRLSQVSVDVPMNELLSDSEVERIGETLKVYRNDYL